MATLYIDCTNGISSDMLFLALKDLGAEANVESRIAGMATSPGVHSHGEDAAAHAHTSYQDILHIIEQSDVSARVRETVRSVYGVIARAEAEVHGESLATVHFHEVGRREAVVNIFSVAEALEELAVETILCSPVHDGHGTILCSHGEIPVPVPAVAAMMKTCDYRFVTDDVPTEMVTPSGLGALLGIGARCVETPPAWVSDAAEHVRMGRGVGTRDIGRDGLKVYYYEGGAKL